MRAPMARNIETRMGSPAVARLDLTRFRNYPSLRLQVPASPSGMIVLTGPNGAGKTNLLEAISYLGPGRGLRAARLSAVACREAGGPWAVSGELSDNGKSFRVGTGLEADKARRTVMKDGEKLPGPAALAALVPLLWLTPRMDRLFQDGASERRRFFDQLAANLFPAHAGEVAAYEKLMRERLKLLTDPARRADEAWLSALEVRMAGHAVAVAATRVETLNLLVAHLPFARKSPFPLPELSLTGALEGKVGEMPALEAEEAFARTLRANRAADREAARTHEGPHRCDLEARHPKKNLPAAQCSTGEQKAMLIGIVLAAARLERTLTGRAPILLLDEIPAHLDEKRRAILFGELGHLAAQVWMSGTDPKLFAPLAGRAAFLAVRHGRIRQTKTD